MIFNRKFFSKIAKGDLVLSSHYEKLLYLLESDIDCSVRASIWFSEENINGFAPICLSSDLESAKFYNQLPSYFKFVDSSIIHSQNIYYNNGGYYPLDCSSIFMASPLFYIMDREQIASAVDLCASPGGKTAAIKRVFPHATLLSNESVGGRIPALLSNIKRMRFDNIMLSRAKISNYSNSFCNFFDLVFLDVPCSGQSMVFAGQQNDGCFNPIVINRCAKIQRALLQESSNIVKSNGYVIYSTCTFSKEENEEVVESFLSKNKNFELVELTYLSEFESANLPRTYKLLPSFGFGLCGFTALLRCKDQELETKSDYENIGLMEIYYEEK